MRDPDNLHKMYEYLEEPDAVIKLVDVPPYDLSDWDLNDEKEFKKFISSIEKKTIRGSFEYRAMVSYLRNYLNMNRCSFYENVNNIDTSKIKIEIHHEPLSLYDITLIVFNKRNALREDLDEESIGEEVMWLHYNLMVGLIPLSSTVHELVHNQYLFVPTRAVMGKYREFVDRYRPYMLPEQLDVLQKIEDASTMIEDDYKTLLSRQYIYVDLTGAFKLPRIEDVVNLVRGRINEIMDENSMPPKVPSEIVEEPKKLIDPLFFES